MKTSLFATIAGVLFSGFLLFAECPFLQASEKNMDVPAAIEEVPVLGNIEPNDLIYSKGDGEVVVTKTITVADQDSRNLYGARIQIAKGFHRDEDILKFKSQNKITGSWDKNSGVLTLSGRTTLDNYKIALRSIRYENTNAINPSTETRTVSFTVSGLWESSNTVSRNIVILSQNLPPVLNNMEVSPVEYCIHAGEDWITSTTTITDADDSFLEAATIELVAGFKPGEDLLRFDDQHEISGTWNDDSGILTLTGKASVVNYQIALRSIRYVNTNTLNPFAGQRDIAVTVTDGTDKSNSVTRRITVHERASASISGNTTTCYDDNTSVPLEIHFTGNSPWTFTLSRDGGEDLTFRDIPSNPYTATVKKEGTYRISSISDDFCKGDTTGSGYARVLFHTPPTGKISGSDSICENTTAFLQVTLTGQPPWRYSYRLNSGDPVEVLNVYASPHMLPVQQAGRYTLVEVFDKYCQGQGSGSALIVVKPNPEVELSGLLGAYRKESEEWVLLHGTPAGGTFSGIGVIPYNQEWFFIPALPPAGTYPIVYAYQASPATCFGYDTAMVRILEADADIEFENNRTNYCTNDAPFIITATNRIGVTGSFTISGNSGLYDHHDNTATIYPSMLRENQYTIVYTYFEETLPQQVESIFYVGRKPTADFTWATECFQAGQSIAFTNTSSSVFGYFMETSYYWILYNSSGDTSYTSRNITYSYPEPGNFRAELQVMNSFGCADTVTKVFTLRPTIPLDGKSYFEDFESKPLSWQSDSSSVTNVNSWQLGTPQKAFSGYPSDPTCWFTFIEGTRPPKEQSWITSPCFDFTNTDRPMLMMDVWRLFNSYRDGANIQFSADSGKTWTLIGQIGDGVNWFNTYDITGNPGGFGIGWSNKEGIHNDTYWTQVRHSLDMLKGLTKVQFRIAYGSDGSAQYNNGFAFDHIWIGEGNRTALIEHFTNTSDLLCAEADSLLDDFTLDKESNIIALQYHTGSPSGDPFYEDNPVIPTTRGFYYGLTSIPYALLNGGSKIQHRFDYSEDSKPFNKNPAIVETLLDSKFQILIHASFSDNAVMIEAEITAREPIPLTELSVRIAVIERIIEGISGENGDTVFRNVVKTMLPGASGTTIYKAWEEGNSNKINVFWPMQHVFDPSELRVIAFVQNENTNEIYQAAIDTISLYTGTENPTNRKLLQESFMIYPNPANSKVMVKFTRKMQEDVAVELYNPVGKLLYSTCLPSNTDLGVIPVDDLPDGFYLLRLVSRQHLLGTERILISR